MTTDTSAFEAYRAGVQSRLFGGIREHVDRLGWSAERIAVHQRDGLRALLAHAIARSPFHAGRLAGVDAERLELGDLSRLPVMTKSEMMDDLDDAVTDRRLSRGLLEETIARTAG